MLHSLMNGESDYRGQPVYVEGLARVITIGEI